MTTRSQTRAELYSISAASKYYYNIFLPHTIWSKDSSLPYQLWTAIYCKTVYKYKWCTSYKHWGVHLFSRRRRSRTSIHRKLMTAKQQLGMIRKALYWTPTNAKLLAYKTSCLPPLSWVCRICLRSKQQQQRYLRHSATPRSRGWTV